jgi:hypothetical protein
MLVILFVYEYPYTNIGESDSEQESDSEHESDSEQESDSEHESDSEQESDSEHESERERERTREKKREDTYEYQPLPPFKTHSIATIAESIIHYIVSLSFIAPRATQAHH